MAYKLESGQEHAADLVLWFVGDDGLEHNSLGLVYCYSSQSQLLAGLTSHTRVWEGLDDFFAVDVDVEFAVLLLRGHGISTVAIKSE